MGMMPGMMGMPGMGMRDRVGVDMRSVNWKAKRESEEKAAATVEEPKGGTEREQNR